MTFLYRSNQKLWPN